MKIHLLTILIPCCFAAKVDSRAKPLVNEAIDALRRNQVKGSNNLMANAISVLLKDVSLLVEAIQATWKVASMDIHDMPGAELRYSYGRSPSVYPSREFLSVCNQPI